MKFDAIIYGIGLGHVTIIIILPYLIVTAPSVCTELIQINVYIGCDSLVVML